jgi:hypothetical protein
MTRTLLCFGLMILVVGGCSDGQPDTSSFNDSNLKRVRNFYELYMDEHRQVGPKNEADFKDYIANGRKAQRLIKKLNLDQAAVENLFTGERDGEPLKVRYGLKGPLNHAFVFESTGVDGKRLVARSPVEEMEAEEYEAWWSGKKKPKPLPTFGEIPPMEVE